MDILFICTQAFDVDMHGFKIIDDKGNQIFDNALTLKLKNMHQGEEVIHIYIHVNDVVTLITIRMPRCFTSKVEDNMRIGVKYFNDDDVVSNKAIQQFDMDELDLLDDGGGGCGDRDFQTRK